MLRCVFEVLTGTGLAASAGLNAYIPLLTMGLLARYTDLIDLPSGWTWLGNGWVIVILAVLLAVEVVADKVPGGRPRQRRGADRGPADRGRSGLRRRLVVGDGDGQRPGQLLLAPTSGCRSSPACCIALGVHLLKSAARPVINATTAGFGAPVASTAEDATQRGDVPGGDPAAGAGAGRSWSAWCSSSTGSSADAPSAAGNARRPAPPASASTLDRRGFLETGPSPQRDTPPSGNPSRSRWAADRRPAYRVRGSTKA